jgi:hypothetical protein
MSSYIAQRQFRRRFWAGVKRFYVIGAGVAGTSVSMTNLGFGGYNVWKGWENGEIAASAPIEVAGVLMASAFKGTVYGVSWPFVIACFQTTKEKRRYFGRMCVPWSCFDDTWKEFAIFSKIPDTTLSTTDKDLITSK